MKNAISYYYNLYAENIHQVEKQYRFEINGETYILQPVDIEINEVNEEYKLSEQLYQYGILCHRMILNQQNQLITIINQLPYILLKTHFHKPEQVILNDCMYLTQFSFREDPKSILRRDQWFQLWTKKIDYMEYQISQFGKKFPIIRESFGYYVGLAETSILLLQLTNVKEIPLYVAHRRINKEKTTTDFYNPLSFVIDSRVRDGSEYFKMRFFENVPILEEIIYYFKSARLNTNELILFFTRMLFPTYYFDLYEQIISNEVPEKKLLEIISKVDEYEDLLRDLYHIMNQYVSLPDMEWLHKKM